jgi:hypothetical protein
LLIIVSSCGVAVAIVCGDVACGTIVCDDAVVLGVVIVVFDVVLGVVAVVFDVDWPASDNDDDPELPEWLLSPA